MITDHDRTNASLHFNIGVLRILFATDHSGIAGWLPLLRLSFAETKQKCRKRLVHLENSIVFSLSVVTVRKILIEKFRQQLRLRYYNWWFM